MSTIDDENNNKRPLSEHFDEWAEKNKLSISRTFKDTINDIKLLIYSFLFTSLGKLSFGLSIFSRIRPILLPVLTLLQVSLITATAFEYKHLKETDNCQEPCLQEKRSAIKRELYAEVAEMGIIAIGTLGKTFAKSLFTKPIAFAAGGLTGIIFTAAMALATVVELGETIYNGYRWHQAKKSDEQEKATYYKQQCINSVFETTLFDLSLAAVTTFILNPVSATAISAIGISAGIFFAGTLLAKNVHHIQSAGKSLVNGIKNLFTRKENIENMTNDHGNTHENRLSSTGVMLSNNTNENKGQPKSTPNPTRQQSGPRFFEKVRKLFTSNDTNEKPRNKLIA